MFIKKFTLSFLMFIIGAINHSAMADEVLSIDELKKTQIENIFHNTESAINIPAEIHSITDRDIERSSLTSIPEILRLAPGLHVAQMNSNYWSVSSRGFNTELSGKLVVMIDGRRIDSELFPTIYWHNQDLLIADIKRIDVIRGTGSNIVEQDSLYRNISTDNALNGVVNIITKRAAETQGSFVNIIHGTEESIKSARYGGKIDNNLFYRIYAKNKEIDGGVNIDNHDTNDDWRDYKIGFKIDWENNVKNQFILQGDLYRGTAKNTTTYPSDQFDRYVKEITEDKSKGGNIISKWLHKRNNGNEITLRGYYDYYKRDYLLFQQKYNTIDVDLQFSTLNKKYGKNILGLSYRTTNSEISYRPQYDFKYQKNNSGLFNAFIQNKTDLISDKLSLTTSLRFQHEDDLKHNEYSNYKFHPSIRSNFKLTKTQSIWSGISKTSRNPTISERYGHTIQELQLSPLRKITLNGNENFKSEELISYELGYRNHYSKNLTADISLFFNDYDNLRTFEIDSITSDEVLYIVKNGLYGESYGTEISSKIAINDNLDLSLNYTFLKLYLHQKYTNGNQLSELDEYSSPQNQFSIRSYYNISDNFQWNNILFYVGRLKKHNIDSYFRFDSNISWKINENAKLSIAGQNLFSNRRKEFVAFIFREGSFAEGNKIYAKLNLSF
jgi:iron complex outermembrane recepter protein